MKFLLANTIVSDGPVVNDVDRRIIIGGKYLEHELAMKTAGCKYIESPRAVQSKCQKYPGQARKADEEPSFMNSVGYIVSKHMLSKTNDKCSIYFAFKNIFTLFKVCKHFTVLKGFVWNSCR